MNAAIRAILLGGGITSSDSDVTAWIATGVPTTQAEVNILTAMVAGIKSDFGILTLNQVFDGLWIDPLGTQTAALRDLAQRVNDNSSATASFTPGLGFTGNGSSTYLNTNFSLSSAANYSRNSACMGAWIQTGETSGSGGHAYGGAGNDSTGAGTEFGRLGSNIFWMINNGVVASTSFAFSSQVGLWHVERSASNLSTLYYNGATTGSTNANASAAIAAGQNAYSLANANLATGGTAVNFTNSTRGAFYIASALGATNIGKLYTRLHTALNALNAAAYP